MPRVVVVGLGYIGLPTAAVLALHGCDVLGVDIRPQVVESLRTGNVPVREKDLTAIVRDAIRTGRLSVAMRPKPADYFILCVPTPRKGRSADLSFVRAAARSIVPYLRKDSTVIVESTVPPGTTKDVVRPLLESQGLRAGRDFSLAYCPERVMPGNIVYEIAQNDRVIGGFDAQSADRARRLYATFVRGQILLTDLTTSEFVKLIENAFRDVNIALSNEIASLAEAHGVNVWEAIELANRHPRVQLLRPGPGVGGHCIAVDPWFLLTPKVKARIIPAARETNDGRPSEIIRRAVGLLRGIRSPRICALGVAYKGNADDIRESPAIEVIEGLRRRGAKVSPYDPLVPHDVYPTLHLEDALRDADLILVLTDHKDFAYLDPDLIARKARGKTVLDTRNCLDHAKWAGAGFAVHLLGSSRVIESERPKSIRSMRLPKGPATRSSARAKSIRPTRLPKRQAGWASVR